MRIQDVSSTQKNLLESARAIKYASTTAGRAADYLLKECFPTAQLDVRTVVHCLQYAVDLVSLRLAVPHFESPSVTFFGSARNDVALETRLAVKELASRMAQLGLTVATGGGPGIMSDANEGAFYVNSKFSSAVPHGGLEGEAPNGFCEKKRSVTMFDFPQRVEGLSDQVLTAAYMINKGGFGTLEERTQVYAFMKGETIGQKQTILYDQGGYWSKINPLLEGMIVDPERRNHFKQAALTTDDVEKIIKKLKTIKIEKPSKHEVFSFQDITERSIEDLVKPFGKILRGDREYTSDDSVADIIRLAVEDKLRRDPNIKNMRVGHANLVVKLFLDSLASIAYQDIFSRDQTAFNNNVTVFGNHDHTMFEHAQEAVVSNGCNLFNRLPTAARTLAPGFEKGMVKRWEGLSATVHDGDDSFDNYKLTLRRRTSSAATALRMSGTALFLPGNEGTLKLAMKALCWTQTEQMHPGKKDKKFTPIFVGDTWATIGRKGQVDGNLPRMLGIMLENNCIKRDHLLIPRFARNVDEALAGEYHQMRI